MPRTTMTDNQTEAMSEEELIKIYGVWGEHPQHSVEDWQYLVSNGDERRGYWGWVESQLEAEAFAED